jgi:RNA polymerase sigma-70 factor (TIGR02960 family)
MSQSTLARARAGDQQAFREFTDPYRRELQLHCYRMLGSLQDAEDMLQETLVAAWRGLARFEGRASIRAWLYRIATNRCLNALRDAGRRPPPAPVAPFEPPAPTRYGEPTWLQPYPDVLLEGIADDSPGPEARYQTREAIELAFVAGLQRLPPRQRAALVLRDVLGFHTAEVAAVLDSSEASVKGALHRARATLDERRLAGSYVAARRTICPLNRDFEPVRRTAFWLHESGLRRFLRGFRGNCSLIPPQDGVREQFLLATSWALLSSVSPGRWPFSALMTHVTSV